MSSEEVLGLAEASAAKRLGANIAIAFYSICSSLGLPAPREAKMNTSRKSAPTYNTILQEIRTNKGNSKFLKSLLSDEAKLSPVIFFFLGWLLMVRSSRCKQDHKNAEKFEMVDIGNEIVTAPELLKLSRSAIAESTEYHGLAVEIALVFLCWLSPKYLEISTSKLRKLVTKHVYGGLDALDGVMRLRNDLARFCVVNRDKIDLKKLRIIADAQHYVFLCQFSQAEAYSILSSSPNKRAFELVLDKHAGSLAGYEHIVYKYHLGLLPESHYERISDLREHSLDEGPPQSERIPCEREGCEEDGDEQCTRCRRVNYCSRQCQEIDWRRRHSKVCQCGSVVPVLNQEAIREAVQSTSTNLALVEHSCLRSVLDADFVFRVKKKNDQHLEAIILEDIVEKQIFRLALRRANTIDVGLMYEILLKQSPGCRERIHAQLLEEYEVDPLLEENRQDAYRGRSEDMFRYLATHLTPTNDHGVDGAVFRAENAFIRSRPSLLPLSISRGNFFRIANGEKDFLHCSVRCQGVQLAPCIDVQYSDQREGRIERRDPLSSSSRIRS